jgi:hypothetical protein
MVQNGLFFCREAPWSHLGANTIPSGPPQAPSGPSLELPKTRKIAPGTPTSAQGPHQIHQANMLKTLEIHVLDPSGPHKSALGRFCDAPSLALRPSKATSRSSGSPLGAQKAPRSVQGLLKELPWTPRELLEEVFEISCFDLILEHLSLDPKRTPWDPRRPFGR